MEEAVIELTNRPARISLEIPRIGVSVIVWKVSMRAIQTRRRHIPGMALPGQSRQYRAALAGCVGETVTLSLWDAVAVPCHRSPFRAVPDTPALARVAELVHRRVGSVCADAFHMDCVAVARAVDDHGHIAVAVPP